ncbi:MAG: hypothetical protein ACOYEV_13115 [Candidatus Nanopelagicales bacterium]
MTVESRWPNNDDGLATVALSITAHSVRFTYSEDTDCGMHAIPLDEATRMLDAFGQWRTGTLVAMRSWSRSRLGGPNVTARWIEG